VGSRSFFIKNKIVISHKFQFIRPHDILPGSTKSNFTTNRKLIFRFTGNDNGKIVAGGREQPFSIPHTQAETRNKNKKCKNIACENTLAALRNMRKLNTKQFTKVHTWSLFTLRGFYFSDSLSFPTP